MANIDQSTSQPRATIGKRMLVGAIIGLLAILFFLIPSWEGNPAWGKLWMIRPLIIVPLAGATGGLLNYYIVHFRSLVGMGKITAMSISAVVFIVGLWMGIILGLDGTLWD